MTGTTFIIDLPGPVAAERLAELTAVFSGLGARFEEVRVGSYDLDVEPGPCRVTVNIAGPGFGDEGVFRAAHVDDPDLKPLIGFTPTHDLVVAMAGDAGLAGRVMIAELTAATQGVVGGVIDIAVSQRAFEVVGGPPWTVAVAHPEAEAEWEARVRLFCTAEFLRAWVAAPEFPDYTLGAAPPRSHW